MGDDGAACLTIQARTNFEKRALKLRLCSTSAIFIGRWEGISSRLILYCLYRRVIDFFFFFVLRSPERGDFDCAVPSLCTLPMSIPIGNLKSLAKCPVCNKKYAPAVVTPLIEDDIHSTMHVSCPSCGVSSILFVSTNQWGIASIGVLTDLEGDESKKLLGKGKDIVSTDEVLDAYMFFKEEVGKARLALERIR